MSVDFRGGPGVPQEPATQTVPVKLSHDDHRVVIIALCACGFVLPFSSLIISPLLVDLSRDLGVSLAEAGMLVTIAAIPGAALALIIGPLGDVYGRRVMLVAGTALLGVAAMGSALAPNYAVMVGSRFVAGFAMAMVGPAMFAAPADLLAYRERGRAYAYIQAAQTVASILGLPAATLLAAQLGWRWSFGFGALTSFAASFLLLRYPKGLHAQAVRLSALFSHGYLPVLRTRQAWVVLMSSFLLSVGWMGLQTYLGAFFITRFGIGTGDLTPITALWGVGMLVGSQVAPRLSDYIGYKAIAVWSVVAAAALAVLLTTSTVLVLAAILNFALAVPIGLRYTSASVITSEAVPSARGTMNAINVAFWGAGTVVGTYLAGIVVETIGFEALGLTTAAGCLASALILGFMLAEHKDSDHE